MLNLFFVLKSRMSGTARLGSIVLCVILCRGQNIVTGNNGGTLESCYIDSPVMHQEASLQKVCALEKNQAAKSS